MAKSKMTVEMYSYGEYSRWDRESRDLPKLLDITDRIKADIGTEFGYILKIKKGKGERLTFRIDHPPFKDDDGKVRPPFEGEYYVNSNDFEFFLGDCVWEPLEDKLGKWTMTTYHNGKVIAEKTITLV
ncbi:DUF3859 domain-containing protein [Puteibacter caeruleilacunae]|nr:DUF3859 domain-containing protein [Puteibacter caeruleilacunae]